MPCFMRWPGKIKAGSVLNGIVSHIDMFPTLLAAAGNPNVTEQLLNGCTVGGKPFNVHLDGYNQVPYLTGEVTESPRNAIVYFSDDGEVIAVRVGDWKFNLAVQRADTMRQWAEPFVKLRLPYIVSLRRDPFERAEFNSNTYLDWMVDHVPQTVPDAGGDGGADCGLREVPAAAKTRLVQPGRGAGACDAAARLRARAGISDLPDAPTAIPGVIPAKAGTQADNLGPRLRGDDAGGETSPSNRSTYFVSGTKHGAHRAVPVPWYGRHMHGTLPCMGLFLWPRSSSSKWELVFQYLKREPHV